MSNQRQKDRKKKQKELRAKERVAQRRKLIDDARKEEKRRHMFEKKFSPKGVTIFNDPERRKSAEEVKKAQVLKQLEYNQQILEALEKEYEAEQAARKEVHEDLEAKGFKTIEEKMKHLQEQAEEKAKADGAKSRNKKGFKFGGQAQISYSPRAEETENSSDIEENIEVD